MVKNYLRPFTTQPQVLTTLKQTAYKKTLWEKEKMLIVTNRDCMVKSSLTSPLR